MTRIEYIIDDDFLDDETKMSAESQGYLWELIRCKDCKYYEAGQNEVDAWRVCQVHHRPIDTWDDNFCGWAERRDDG